MHTENLQTIKWNKENYYQFLKLLEELGEEQYFKFSFKIIPELGFSYGVRMPILRKISKEVSKNVELNKFYNLLDEGRSYEEKLIQGMLIPKLKYLDTKELFEYIELYILRINNWALCDTFVSSLRPVIIKNQDAFFVRIKKYLNSKNAWEVRFGLILLNNYYADENHLKKIFSLITTVNNDNYYVKMGIAWLLSTCYFQNRELTIEFINSNKITVWCKNKALQKILESKKLLDKNERNEIIKLKEVNKK